MQYINWKEIHERIPGTFACSPADPKVVTQHLRAAGFRLVKTLDCAGVQNRDDLWSQCSDLFVFPNYFHMNWDSFSDCLRESAIAIDPNAAALLTNFGHLSSCLEQSDIRHFVSIVNTMHKIDAGASGYEAVQCLVLLFGTNSGIS
ncbi:MAG: barstar family protein [Phycisphaeraceae bacterium]|nr:barstar family protein [Phycisphaeraceae bacterium]